MFNLTIGFAVGLIVGWNFLPQPAIVKGWVDSALASFKSK